MEEERREPAQRHTGQPAHVPDEDTQGSRWEPPQPNPELIGIIDKAYAPPSNEWVDEAQRLSASDGHD